MGVKPCEKRVQRKIKMSKTPVPAADAPRGTGAFLFPDFLSAELSAPGIKAPLIFQRHASGRGMPFIPSGLKQLPSCAEYRI